VERTSNNRHRIRLSCAAVESPFDPLASHVHLALAYAALEEERYGESAAYWGKCAQANPDLGMFVIGQAQMLALEPEFRIRTVRELGWTPVIMDKMVLAARSLGARE
jgi:hypothetical protein